MMRCKNKYYEERKEAMSFALGAAYGNKLQNGKVEKEFLSLLDKIK